MSERINSERAYFSFRYTLPGYTFLTMILLINIELLISQMKKFPEVIPFFGIIIAFISLLSGSAIGFIISQLWYLIYNYPMKSREILRARRHYQRLMPLIRFTDDDTDLISIMAYILTYKVDNRITSYINRLNDMINSLASTFSAMFLGLCFGYIYRFGTLRTFRDYDLIIIGFSIFFMLILYANLRVVWKEHDYMADLILRLKNQEINDVFRFLNFV